MRAGSLRHLINLVRYSSTRNAYGEPSITWSTDKTVWAAVWPLRGQEYYQAQQVSASVTHKIRIRYTTLSNSTALGPKHRVEMKDGSRMFEIDHILNVDERNIYLDLMCKEAT